MGRPKLKEASKKKALSISVAQDILDLASKVDNKSVFFERSVRCCNGIVQTIAALDSGKLRPSQALEDIEDIMAGWESLGEETIPFDQAFPGPKGVRAPLAQAATRKKKKVKRKSA